MRVATANRRREAAARPPSQTGYRRLEIRCPNGFERGAPTDVYTHGEVELAITQAEAILEYCRRQIGR